MLATNSPLSKLPPELRRRDVFLIEGIRYAIGAIDESYNALVSELRRLSKESGDSKNDYYGLFKEVWSIIDFGWRLRALFLQFDTAPGNEEDSRKKIDLDFLDSLKEFRHTFQHLDERIDEAMVDENAYVWGYLSWLHVLSPTSIESCGIAPGHPRGTVTVINPAGLVVTPPLCHITLETINRKKEKITINLSQLVSDIAGLTKQFENDLNIQFSGNTSESIAQDFIFRVVMSASNQKDS